MATLGESPGTADEPLRLNDEVGEFDDVVEPNEPRGWSRWTALAIAFAVGAGAAVVVMNARQDATERSDVNIVVAGSALSAGSPSRLEFAFMNAGATPVDILDIEVVGWTPVETDELRLRAPVAQWTRVSLLAEPNCDERPDTAVTLTIRTDTGDNTIDVPLAERDHLDLTTFWSEACPTRPIADVNFEFARTLRLDADGLVMQFDLHQFDERRLHIVDVESATGGFSAHARDLPIPLVRAEPTRMTVEWEVVDCDATEEVSGAFVSVSVVGKLFGPTRSRVAADNRTLAELARLTALACET